MRSDACLAALDASLSLSGGSTLEEFGLYRSALQDACIHIRASFVER